MDDLSRDGDMNDNLPKSEFSPDRAKKPLPMPTEPDTPPAEWRKWLDSQYDQS